MAIRVIAPGPGPAEKKAVCKDCGATLGYVPNDIKEYNGHDYGGGPDGCQWIDCPECGKRVILKSW
jgi:hypothetical protein